jgi:protein-S-isoprenylcysteine O-methyltransferase Ste14
MKLKIPPPIVALIAAACMWLLSHAVPTLAFALPLRRSLAGACVVLGFAVAISAVVCFRRVKTTVNPLDPRRASSLVTGGVFRYTRNPMYLGLLLVLLGWSLYLSHVLPFLVLPVFIAYITRYQIVPEESALASKFGEDFTAYRSRVRRWI